MNLHDLDTPFEPHQIIEYAKDGNTVVRHRHEMQPICGPFYKGREEQDDIGMMVYPIYQVFDASKAGQILVKKSRTVDGLTSEQLEQWARENRMDTLERYLERCDEAISANGYFKNAEIEFIRQFDESRAARCTASREAYLRAREEKEARERMQREAENRKFVQEMNEKAEEQVQAAVSAIKGDGLLRNESVSIYKSRYTCSTYSVVNLLMRRYGIDVPLRTQGWINEKLIAVQIRNGRTSSVEYRSSRTSRKGSQSFSQHMNALIAAIRASKEAA